MAETNSDKKITLFFVKNANHQLGPVEKFLTKRGYNVRVQSNVPVAMDEIMELNPEYIFLAWDHKNETIRQMPKNLYASCTGQVVPFIMSTQRDQIIQLESSGFENKLYPPLSGPAIIRVISKYEKKNQVFDQINQKKGSAAAKKESGMIQVKSFFNQEDESGAISMRKSSVMNNMEDGERKMVASRSRGQAQKFAQSQSVKQRPLASIKQEGTKAKLMQAVEEEIASNELMSAVQKSGAKNNLLAAIEREFAKKGASPSSLMQSFEEEIEKLNDLAANDQRQTKSKLAALLDAQLSDDVFPEIEIENQDGASANETVEDADGSKYSKGGYGYDGEEQPISAQLPKFKKSLSKGQTLFLDQSFNDTIKPEMFDLIESYADQASTEKLTETTQVYVLAVQELEWTGYLTVASENYLDVASAQEILNGWIKQMIRVERVDQNPDESTDMPDLTLFEMRIPKVNFADFCSYKADFFKDVEYQGKKTMLGFFPFSPFEVINSIHEAHDMLELPVQFLQSNKELPFDVNLYLPENKRFLLYIKPGSFLDDAQVSRLQTRKVEYIYSNMDYELALLKYKAEFNIQALIDSYQRIKGSNT